ncbi:site-2 protease family protein [Streptomyces sp. W16]|uniref:site-2 protease family protein n=1 Tax=Streptomyces sp. W16 TaxID=3076631 RepID=UPI00295B4ECF|nr:site-2 protease family protein [Streptomyces sp. W16]MDV9169231.1 site-2 protease family protein [Streptomyces sp. W16]
MDESGGSAQPRSGNDEPTEHATGATTPAADPGTPRPEHDDSDRSRPETSAQAPEEQKDASTPSGEHEGAGALPESDQEASTSPENGDAETATSAESSGPTPNRSTAAEATGMSPGPAAADHTGPGPSSASAPLDRTDTDTASHDAARDRTPAPSTPAEAPSAAPTPARLNGEPKPGGAPTGKDHGADHTDEHDRAPSHPNHPYAHTDPDSTPHTGPGIAKGRPPQRPKEPGGGILMGRPFGVPVYVAPSWFLVAALITWVFGGQLDRVLPELGAARYLVALFFAVAFYGSVLVHELAHTVAALRFKLPVRRIQLQFFGGVSEIEKEAETPGREFVLAFVGPLLSLILSGIFYLAMQPVEPGTVPGVLLAGLMVSNLIVAAFNLLPGLPLDGGRMLRAVVWKITGRPMSGTIAAAWVGRALAVSVLIGLPLLTQTGALGTNTEDISGMDTVTDALLAAILAAIIWTGAGNSLRMARLREHLPDLRARNLTRRAVPVETNTPLSEALRRANAAGARALVVVDADGQPLSLVREAAIVGVPEHRRPWVSVSGLAQDLTEGMRVSAELAGEDLLDTLRATPATEYLVVEETGEIYGVLSAADVERAFVKAMARPN